MLGERLLEETAPTSIASLSPRVETTKNAATNNESYPNEETGGWGQSTTNEQLPPLLSYLDDKKVYPEGILVTIGNHHSPFISFISLIRYLTFFYLYITFRHLPSPPP